MTHTQTTRPKCIALWAGKKGMHPAEVEALASVFEKSATKFKLKQKLLKYKCTIQIATFNVRTPNTIGQQPELTESAIDHNIDIICIQEHRYNHGEYIKYHDTGNGWTLATASACKKSVNATIGGEGMLRGPRVLKSLNNIEKIPPRMMVANLITTPAQQSSSATTLPMIVKKLTSSPSMVSYSPLFVASQNKTFSSLVETWTPKLVKTLTTNSAYTIRKTEMGNI